MNTADEAINVAIQEAQLLRKGTKKKKTLRVTGSERDIIRATVMSWFYNHRKQLTAVFTDAELAEIDQRYQWTLEASHKITLRSSYVEVLKQNVASLVTLRSGNVIKLSAAAAPTPDAPPDFSPIVQDAEMKTILEDRWVECTLCVADKTPLAATVMIGGLLEGVVYARISRQANKAPIYTAAAAPKDKAGKTLPLKEWKLQSYIGVAHELKWITQTVRDLGEVLRDYRNYIHPHKQYSEKMSLAPEDAKILWEISKSITRQLLTP